MDWQHADAGLFIGSHVALPCILHSVSVGCDSSSNAYSSSNPVATGVLYFSGHECSIQWLPLLNTETNI
jgi:hypothetical protein